MYASLRPLNNINICLESCRLLGSRSWFTSLIFGPKAYPSTILTSSIVYFCISYCLNSSFGLIYPPYWRWPLWRECIFLQKKNWNNSSLNIFAPIPIYNICIRNTNDINKLHLHLKKLQEYKENHTTTKCTVLKESLRVK